MSLKTRGSSAVDKAERRLALLKSIHAELDLGHGLNVEVYHQLIETTRATLEAHNTLLSQLDESRKTVTRLDAELSEMSERMLTGVASVYGRNSIEYAKAGGSNRKRKQSTSVAATPTTSPIQTATVESTNSNGKTSTTVS